jgi:hypothetical protein
MDTIDMDAIDMDAIDMDDLSKTIHELQKSM